MGRALNSEKIYVFNGQFNIWDQVEKSANRVINPLLAELADIEAYSKFFDIIPHLKKGNTPIFYFNSTKSEWDVEQSHFAKKIQNLYPFYIKSNEHGIPFYKQNLRKVLTASVTELKKWSINKHISPFLFSVRTEGLLKSLRLHRINHTINRKDA